MGRAAEPHPPRKPGLSTVVTAIVLTAVLAGALGSLGGLLGVQPVIIWVVLFPMIVRLLWALGFHSQARAAAPASAAGTVLLDATARWRRLVQVVLPIVGVMVSTVGVSQLVRADIAAPAWAAPAAIAGVVAIVVALVTAISWEVSYRGHRIRFDNYPCLAERLFIDGLQVDRGGIGVNMTLQGTIAGGEGAGERIVASSHAGLLDFSCRIVAESGAAKA